MCSLRFTLLAKHWWCCRLHKAAPVCLPCLVGLVLPRWAHLHKLHVHHVRGSQTNKRQHSVVLLCLKAAQTMYVKVQVSQSCLTLCDPMNLYSPWNSPGQDTGVGSLSLLQGIFPIQGLNPGLPHGRQIFHQLSHKGSPRLCMCSVVQ